MSNRDSQTLRLPDGRTLGFAEYGVPSGTPIFLFHGFPASRLESFYTTRHAIRHNLRIISPDRPGFGLSTFQPGRRITDWPADVGLLADHLGIERFAVLGGSGGGPYALACAHLLPPERLTAVGLVACAPPWIAGTQEISLPRRALAVAARYLPGPLAFFSWAMIGMLRWAVTTSLATRWIDSWLEQATKKRVEREAEAKRKGEEGFTGDQVENVEKELDAASSQTPQQRRELLVRTAFEGFAQGARGFVQETQLLTADWGFKFEDVAYDKILLWHGLEDKQCPIRMIRYMTKRLPHADLHEYPGITHFSVGNHLDEVFTDLLAEQKLRK